MRQRGNADASIIDRLVNMIDTDEVRTNLETADWVLTQAPIPQLAESVNAYLARKLKGTSKVNEL